MWNIACLSPEIFIQSFSNFYFLVLVVLLILVLFVLFQDLLISLYLIFLCSFQIIILIFQRYLQCQRILFLLLFSTHIDCLRHHCNIRPYASSLVYLSGLFVEVLPLSNSTMVLSISQHWQPRYLFCRWDFCYIVWFRVVFCSPKRLFSSFISICLKFSFLSHFDVLSWEMLFINRLKRP